MGPCSRSVLITFTVRVTKHHSVNLSFLTETSATPYRGTIGLAALEDIFFCDKTLVQIFYFLKKSNQIKLYSVQLTIHKTVILGQLHQEGDNTNRRRPITYLAVTDGQFIYKYQFKFVIRQYNISNNAFIFSIDYAAYL